MERIAPSDKITDREAVAAVTLQFVRTAERPVRMKILIILKYRDPDGPRLSIHEAPGSRSRRGDSCDGQRGSD